MAAFFANRPQLLAARVLRRGYGVFAVEEGQHPSPQSPRQWQGVAPSCHAGAQQVGSRARAGPDQLQLVAPPSTAFV